MKSLLKILSLLICAASLNFAQQKTAAQIVKLIKEKMNVPDRPVTVDQIKTGDSTAVVKGIAVTMMATLDVLERAVAKGANFIISHESVFFYHNDPKTPMSTLNDPVYNIKKTYIDKHQLIVYRFHDHFHAKKDGIVDGVMKKLGWEKYQDKENERIFHLPQTTLKKLAETVKQKIGVDAMRISGDPNAKVSTVAFSPGYGSLDGLRPLVQTEGVDVLMLGEAWEWETGEYMIDAIKAKDKKGYIVLGHIPSEQAGMEYFAEWLKTFIKDIPIHFIPTKEMFWMLK